MNVSRAELKKQAREQMSGKFGALFVCFLAVWGISFICTRGFSLILMPRIGNMWMNMFDVFRSSSPDILEDMEGEIMSLSSYSNLANALSLAYWFLVYPVLSVGLSQVLLNLTYGDIPNAGTVFEPYKTRFGKSIGTVWLKKLFEALWVIPFYFAALVCVGIMIGIFASDDTRIDRLTEAIRDAFDLNGDIGSAVFTVIGIVFAFIIMAAVIMLALMIPYQIIISKYAMSLYVMNERPELTSTQCVDESKRMMLGHRWEFFVLKLSFLPWLLLCLIPFVGWLSLIYVVPYMQVTCTNFYHNIKPVPVQPEFRYAEAGDITQIVETAADNIAADDIMPNYTATDDITTDNTAKDNAFGEGIEQ